jgi:hypothetical protein
VQFGALEGEEEECIRKMAQAIAEFYGGISKRSLGPEWPKRELVGYFPAAAFFPHLPLPKRGVSQKGLPATVPYVTELHMRGLIASNRWRNLRGRLDKHVTWQSHLYIRGDIRSIQIDRLSSAEDISDAVEYVLDGLRERIFIPDDIMVLDFGCSSMRPAARHDFESCSGYDGDAVFSIGY